jgi:CRP-like cAMP-binding protein
LQLQSKYSQTPGLIYLDNGNPIHATNGSLYGLDAINSLFGWLEADFSFSKSGVDCEKTIQKSRMNIILDSLSLLDEGVIKVLGPVIYQDKEGAEGESAIPIVKGPWVDYMYVVDEEPFSDGQPIAVEGSHGQWIWVVLEGAVTISKDTHEGPVDILRIGDGGFVGTTTSFSLHGNVRSANAHAHGQVVLGVVDSQRLVEDFGRLSDDYRDILRSLDNRLRQVTDYAARLYRNRNPFKELTKDRTSVIQQGSKEQKLEIITQGTASVVRRIDEGAVPLAILEADDYIGKIPFVDIGQEPDAASVLGSEDLEVKPLDADALSQEHDRLSQTFRNLVEHIATCISVTTRVANEQVKRSASEGKPEEKDKDKKKEKAKTKKS